MTMHKKMAETMDTVIEEIKAIQKHARENNGSERSSMANDRSFRNALKDGQVLRLLTDFRSKVLSVLIRFRSP